jgi:hypothetical protein
MTDIAQRRAILRGIGEELPLRTKERNELHQLTSLGITDFSAAEVYLCALIDQALAAGKILPDAAATLQAKMELPIAA